MSTTALTYSQDIAELVRKSRETKTPLVDYGLAHRGLGHAPPNSHTAIQLTGGLIEHHVPDMTVRAHAGMKLGELQATLRENNQLLPIDADDDLSLGEILTHNVYGALRQGFGSVRDLVLGLSFIDGRGDDIAVGGRTVKNVAGLDVSRFMVGSLGQFGIVHTVTLRTSALPPQATWVELTGHDPGPFDALVRAALLTDANPQLVDCRYDAPRWVLRMGYLGKSAATAVQVRSLETLDDAHPDLHVTHTGHGDMRDLTRELSITRAWRRTAGALVKLVVPPNTTGRACRLLKEWSDSNHPLHIDALPPFGCVMTGGHLSAEQARSLDRVVRDVRRSLGGFAVWHARPGNDPSITPFSPEPSEMTVLRKLKHALDPDNLLNPGRML
ncbi:MAG: FAD-binding protein [Phycisphaera sp.]|nr:FAD-binding protein [Phycisphaera sp.]